MNDASEIAAYFEQDHDEIDALLAGVDFADAGRARAPFAEFDRRLERHIVWEEEILFPAAGRAAPPLEAGPIAVMRSEHLAIRALKRAAREALERGDAAEAERQAREMLAVLGPHNMKEERILYPACDQVLAGPGAEVVLGAVRASSGA